MLEKAKCMNEDNNVLPVGFDGTFRFTNYTDQEFKAKWGNVEYTFPPKSTTPLLMNATPVEIQHIRKKFAKELAVQEFYKSKKMESLERMNPVGMTASTAAVTYTESDLTEYIQRCLEPLPVARAKVEVLPKSTVEANLKKDKKGKPVTRALEGHESLLQEGSNMID